MKCDKLQSLVSDTETATINTVLHMHICVSVLWTSLFFWIFDDNKKALLFPTTLFHIRILIFWQITSKIQGFTAIYVKIFQLQVLHRTFKKQSIGLHKHAFSSSAH